MLMYYYTLYSNLFISTIKCKSESNFLYTIIFQLYLQLDQLTKNFPNLYLWKFSKMLDFGS